MAEHVLQGTLILTDRLVENGQVVVKNGQIIQVCEDGSGYLPTMDYGRDFIAPGFIDLHVHGIAGADVMDASVPALRTMSQRFATHGVTSYLPSTVTQSLELTRRTISAICEVASEGCNGAQILGIHLEGPFLNAAHKGMQNPSYLLAPDISVAESLIDLAGGAVCRVSLAPELPGASELIRYLRNRDILVSMAHTGASYEQAKRAVREGVTQVTHCFNAMTGLHHRHPGVAGAAMLEGSLYTEMIADGIHLHPAVMQLLVRVKGPDRIMLVSDAMSAADMADGVYAFGGHDVTVRQGQARMADGTLASSTLTMDEAVRNVVRMCGFPLTDAVVMASTSPAAAMGWGNDKGRLVSGYDADLAILDQDLQVRACWVGGQLVFPQAEERPQAQG